MPLPDDTLLEVTGFEDIHSLKDLLQLRESLMRLYTAMAPEGGGDAFDQLPKTVFLTEGDPVCRLMADVASAEGLSLSRQLPFDRQSIEFSRDGKWFLYQTKLSGYLVWNEGLAVISPILRLSPYLLSFRRVPLCDGKEGLSFYLSTFCEARRRSNLDPNITILSPEEAALLPNGPEVETPLIRGLEPLPGRDARIRVLVKEETPVDSLLDQVDYRDFHHYIVASTDQLLVEKEEATAGRTGVTVDGKRIEVDPGKDRPFTGEENIRAESKNGVTRFFAAIGGVVHLSDHSVSVTELMVVEGNVDLKTGNVVYEKDVLIKGSVLSGFSVFSKGSVFITGLVENGVELRSEGNLSVQGGVIGSDTRIQAGGDAAFGFVQDARVYCEGNLLINKYALNAHLFAGGVLSVFGKGVKERHQAVSGGSCAAMLELRLHSVGSSVQDTSLIAGYNSYAEQSLRNIEEAIAALELHINKLMSHIGLDLDLTKAKDRIINMRPDQRAKLKGKLVELKMHGAKREELLLELERRKEAVYQHNPELLKITIHGQLVPRVSVQMMDDLRLYKAATSGVALSFRDGAIVGI
ncbi:DUF342 domain-containing protein [Sediminispirochaeta smaragdinae]|uniref:Flagellar Assembly Protein A N-terminal region domain-containing protein n=1 Tax=Sediminispirochaeta smaragdinae (strain DSM 11293 / JCM 15392 / SEBR 4228) TaxID=573413 RepID=E1R5X9_SEDSS|nr:FapA family protein [Sediminispirochaeta smaragdinae]ADK80744.1 protein of unknown function DUF342 [Sediminispirochaeta smaragdinae DSM 11293]